MGKKGNECIVPNDYNLVQRSTNMIQQFKIVLAVDNDVVYI